MNLDLQAKMIEELIMKNNQLSEENNQHLQVKGPFAGSNHYDSVSEALQGVNTG